MSESDSCDYLSDYSEETIDNANAAFIYGEEHQFGQMLVPLQYAARRRYRYAMSQFAFWVLERDDEHTHQKDIFEACHRLLMAAYRCEEAALNYLSLLQAQTQSMEYLAKASHTERKAWLRGRFDDKEKAAYPFWIRTAVEYLVAMVVKKEIQ